MLAHDLNIRRRKHQPAEDGLEDHLNISRPTGTGTMHMNTNMNTNMNMPLQEVEAATKKKRTSNKVNQILLAWAMTTLVMYKATLCCEKLKFKRVADYVWLPSLFGWDLIFFALLYHVIQRWSTKLLAVLVVLTASIVTVEVTSLRLNHISVPWDMLITVLKDWKAFQGLVASKTVHVAADKEGDSDSDSDGYSDSYSYALRLKINPLYQTLLLQIIGTAVLTLLTTCATVTSTSTSTTHGTTHTPIIARTMAFIERHMRKIRLLSLCYTLLVWTTRPSIPYKELSATPPVSAPFRILQGVLQERRNQRNRKRDIPNDAVVRLGRTMAKKRHMKKTDGEPDDRLNVVFILLETVRNDVMPFDGTTPWAQEQIVQDPKIWEQVTPFFSNLTKSPNTLHIPMAKSAAALTHKSLVSIFCSQYAMPIKLTVEHDHTFYHECLPQILDSFGYNSQFFKSLTGLFDHQRAIMQKIGYPNIYSHETYTDMYHPTKEFMEDHRANYFGMEDSVHLPAVLDWVDDMKNKTDPFFLTYLSGVTHDPYDMPPHWEGRKPQFSKDKKINGYLNAISYTDEFLKNVTQEFDKRNLTENTLFVLMGDHGFTAKQRTGSMTTFDVNFEEAFNVGVTFHTKNKKVAKRLRAAKAHVEKGKWVSIDVIPTILNILNLPNFQPPTASNAKSKINSNSTTSSVPLSEFADGRSMLQPSGKRLQVSLSNPGDGMVLRDGDRLIVVPVNEVPEIFDMELDPGQLKPIPIDQSGVTDKRIKDHIKWGKKAAAFVDVLKNDILRAYKTGKRCTSVHKACALELLASLESLDQWEGPSSKTMDQTTFSTRWFPFLRSS